MLKQAKNVLLQSFQGLREAAEKKLEMKYNRVHRLIIKVMTNFYKREDLTQTCQNKIFLTEACKRGYS